MNRKQFTIISVLYLAITCLSFGGFKLAFSSGVLQPTLPGGGLSGLISPVVPKAGGGTLDTSAPRTEACPLNGDMFTKAERDAWEKRRPLSVMIENHPEARPQSGLAVADIIYETVAEGGITRFMGVYYCGAQAKDQILAPVRSARQAYIDYASEYNYPLYAHVGGANGVDTDKRVQALEHLSDYGWTGYNDLNQFSIGYPVFVRNYNRVPGKELATEHTMESSTFRLWDYAASQRELTNLDNKGKDWKTGFIPWEFQDDLAVGERVASQKIAYDFWSGVKGFDVVWDYDKESNLYKRSMAGEAHVDSNSNQQLSAKNVLVLYTKEYPSVDIHKHVFYQTIGTGNATLFQNGKQIPVTWSKKDRTARLSLIDSKGRPIKFVRGQIWITILAIGNTSLSVQ